jgi:hypothetical protein
VKRVGPAVTDANEQELVVRQKTDAKGVVELTVARRWVVAAASDELRQRRATS